MNTPKIPFSFEKTLIPAFLLILNLVLKLIFLNSGDISGDEPFTIFYAQVDFETLSQMLVTENNPPLFFFLVHFWVKLCGISAVSARFLPLIFSSLTVLFIYKIGHKFFNLRVALLASLLFTFSNYHIYFAHETRVYSLFALLTATSMYSFLILIKEPQNRKQLIFLILSNTLLIYAHFFGFFVLFIQGVALLSIQEIRKSIFRKYVVASAISLALYAPYIPLLITRFTSSSGGTWLEPPSDLSGLYFELWKFSNQPLNTVIFLLILTSALTWFIVQYIKKHDNASSASKVAVIWFLLPYLFMYFVSFKLPIFLDRYLIFLTLGYYFCIAIAINYLSKNKWLGYSLSALTVVLMISTCNPKKADEIRQNKALVETVVELKTENTLVYLCPKWIDLGFTYYYNTEYFKDFKNTSELLNKDNIYAIYGANEMNDQMLQQYKHAVYVAGDWHLTDPGNLVYNKLSKYYPNIEKNDQYHGYTIYLFSK